MLFWNKELWLIDHGAALYFHHSWDGHSEAAIRPFAQVKDHVLLPYASRLAEVDAEFRGLLTPTLIREVVELVPEEWLTTGIWTESPAAVRRVYSEFLNRRVENSSVFVENAIHARKTIV